MALLYENVHYRGYSVQIDGDFTPDAGTIEFRSLRVAPKSEVTVYNRKNDLLVVHNGTSDKVACIADLAPWVNKGDLNNGMLSINIKPIRVDKNISARNVVTGKEVIPVVEDMPGHGIFFALIILILAGFGIYFVYVSYLRDTIRRLLKSSNDT